MRASGALTVFRRFAAEEIEKPVARLFHSTIPRRHSTAEDDLGHLHAQRRPTTVARGVAETRQIPSNSASTSSHHCVVLRFSFS